MKITDEMVEMARDAIDRDPFHALRSGIEAVAPLIRSAALEEAAEVIDENVEGVSANERVIVPRHDGNLAGIAYATAIRALKDKTHE